MLSRVGDRHQLVARLREVAVHVAAAQRLFRRFLAVDGVRVDAQRFQIRHASRLAIRSLVFARHELGAVVRLVQHAQAAPARDAPVEREAGSGRGGLLQQRGATHVHAAALRVEQHRAAIQIVDASAVEAVIDVDERLALSGLVEGDVDRHSSRLEVALMVDRALHAVHAERVVLA